MRAEENAGSPGVIIATADQGPKGCGVYVQHPGEFKPFETGIVDLGHFLREGKASITSISSPVHMRGSRALVHGNHVGYNRSTSQSVCVATYTLNLSNSACGP